MKLARSLFAIAALPALWAVAALVAAPAVPLADEYAEAAAAYGTTAFVEDEFMPANAHLAKIRAVKVAVAEAPRGVEEFLAEVFMPAASHEALAETEELGAASAEPEEALAAPAPVLTEGERLARERWLETIWTSP